MRRIILLAAFLLTACVPAAPGESEDIFFAPDFALPTLTGETLRLSDFRGQPVVVNFWATWCAPCVDEMPVLQEISDDGIAVLGINMREDGDTIREFTGELGVSYPILLNPDDATVMAYVVVGLPQTLVIDPAGVVVYRMFGPVNADDLRARIPR